MDDWLIKCTREEGIDLPQLIHGKRLSRPNAKNDWQTTDVPDLRIVSQKLFDAAQSRKQVRGKTHPNQQRRPRHML